jgi:exopolyphosphatase/guanosine-5'-triphosphate,3'-diphosphate pyrophosphatase
MRLAAIDIGSNSLHLVIVDADSAGAFQIVGREKEMVRLGDGLAQGCLSADAMERALVTLRRYKQLAEAHQVERVLAVATSAVRGASNGRAFLSTVGEELGFCPRAITGEEEARLIYRAVLHSIDLEGKRALVVDVGGGSLEMALGAGADLQWAVSEELGALRLTRAFIASDPLSAEDERRLAEHVAQVLRPHALRAAETGFDCVVGTSGTILALGELALGMEHGGRPESLHHVTIAAKDLHAVRRHLAASDLRARQEMSGMARRADIVVAGAVVVSTLLHLLEAEELILCDWALREGLLVDYLRGHKPGRAIRDACPDVRRLSVMNLAARCRHDAVHARHVAALALSIFDQTCGGDGGSPDERTLLEYAALLHDVGHHISYPDHDRHGHYLIKSGDLRGFDPTEVEIMASVARYHHDSRPRKKHAGYGDLPPESQQTVKVLTACVRLADALDRTHRQVVRHITFERRGNGWGVLCGTAGGGEVELWAAARAKDLLEEVLGSPVQVERARNSMVDADLVAS